MLERNEPLTKKDTLEFIRAHREALNEKTVKASLQEEGQFLPEMQMWNSIEAQVMEMTAVEYLKARKELCNSQACKNCPLSTHNTKHCAHMEFRMPTRAVEIVKKWKEEQENAD